MIPQMIHFTDSCIQLAASLVGGPTSSSGYSSIFGFS